MTLAWLLTQFALCALLIARAGFVLSRIANRLATFCGWGRGWVGLVIRPQGRVLRVTSWVSIGWLAAYVINFALVYLAGG